MTNKYDLIKFTDYLMNQRDYLIRQMTTQAQYGDVSLSQSSFFDPGTELLEFHILGQEIQSAISAERKFAYNAPTYYSREIHHIAEHLRIMSQRGFHPTSQHIFPVYQALLKLNGRPGGFGKDILNALALDPEFPLRERKEAHEVWPELKYTWYAHRPYSIPPALKKWWREHIRECESQHAASFTESVSEMLTSGYIQMWYDVQEELARRVSQIEVSGTISESETNFRDFLKYTELNVWSGGELAALDEETLRQWDALFLWFFTEGIRETV